MLQEIKNWYYNQRLTSLGPILSIFNFLCICRRNTTFFRTLYFNFHLYYNIIYVINLCFNLIFNFEYSIFITFVNYSAYLLSPLKMGSFAKWHIQWESLIDMLNELEEESTSDASAEHTKIVIKYKKYCHWVIYGFWIACMPIVFIMFVFYWLKDILVFHGEDSLKPIPYIFHAWLPFDQNSPVGRCISALLQTIFGFLAPLHTCSWDTLVMASMVFLSGQFKALRIRCANSLDKSNDDIGWKNIMACYFQHIKILKCQKLFNSLISPIMSIYLLQISLNCGICILRLVMNRDNMAVVISTIDLLLGVNLQLLLFYWVANEVTVQSENLAYGIFESSWVSSNVRVRRAVLLLSVGMRQRVAFSAGLFNEMSLATFIAVLRSSYSFYTLLSRS